MLKKPSERKAGALQAHPELLAQIEKIENKVRRQHKSRHIRKSNVAHGDILPRELTARVRRLIDFREIENERQEDDDDIPSIDQKASVQSLAQVHESRLKVEDFKIYLF